MKILNPEFLALETLDCEFLGLKITWDFGFLGQKSFHREDPFNLAEKMLGFRARGSGFRRLLVKASGFSV